MTTTVKENSLVIWQETKNEDMPVGEPALVLNPYSDCIQIEQAGQMININYGSIDEICKALKNLKKHESK